MEELSRKKINKSTLIWYEGLADWVNADTLEELKSFVSKQIPPPLHQTTQTIDPPGRPRRNTFGTILQIIGGIGGLLILISVANKAMESSDTAEEKTYEERVMTVEEIERSNPTNFLSTSGKYNQNFWGDKVRIRGTITNKATVVSYKDAILRVTYYTKTNTEIGHKDHTIYEILPPHSTINFDIKIDNYRDVNSVGWEVIDASVN